MAAAITPEGIQDDKAQYVIPFVLDLLHRHEETHAAAKPFTPAPPLIVGLTAPQGAGKSVLVSLLEKSLTSPPHNLSTAIFSLDDFYLPHEGLIELAKANPDNPLLQHRGQPSTHDIPLIRKVFTSLKENKPTRIPQFNKAAYDGHGDRVPEKDWLEVNTDPTNPVRVVLFEGWCVGFRPVPKEVLETKHNAAAHAAQSADNSYHGRLGHNSQENVDTINQALKQYDEITSQFDGLIHIDAEDLLYVYAWRLEQEHNLIKVKGSGMTDEQVKAFVDGYYPSYELYVDGMRAGVFKTLSREESDSPSSGEGRQLRLVVGKDRKVTKVEKL